MKISLFHEKTQRGTADFPIEYYKLDKTHPRYHMQTHWHKDIEIIKVTSGVLSAQVGDVMYVLKEGDSLYIPEGITHGAEPCNCEYECIVFSTSIMNATQKSRNLLRFNIQSPTLLFNNRDINALFDSFRTLQPGYEFEVIGSIYKITYAVLNNQKSTPATTDFKAEKIKPSILYIEENFKTNISLLSLAEKCSMSANYFCKVFKEVTSQTPIEYITTYRLEAACEKLLSGANVTATAYDCGFNDLSYFIHVFKRNIGVSPKKYSLHKNK